MNILIHDYAGHPFQVELSRALAARGHIVDHAYFGADSGPKGRMESDSTENLTFSPVGLSIPYSKTNFLKRRQGDLAYGKELATKIENSSYDIVISGNTPTEAQEKIVRSCAKKQIPFIYWCQDFYSIAAANILSAKIPVFGSLLGAYYKYLERGQMKRAAKVVLITSEFLKQTDEWNIDRRKCEVIPNWGAINEIPLLPRENSWAAQNNLKPGKRFLYSGTLALKHNPKLLAELARNVESAQEVVVVSAGVGTDKLAEMKASDGLTNLKLLPLQPFEALPEVLASSDVLLAVIERDAGSFSVPSKILSYLCAGRPIVLAAPQTNLAAIILQETGAGVVVEPEDVSGFVAAANAFGNDEHRALEAGKNGRRYAEANFDLAKICEQFEEIFNSSVQPNPSVEDDRIPSKTTF